MRLRLCIKTVVGARLKENICKRSLNYAKSCLFRKFFYDIKILCTVNIIPQEQMVNLNQNTCKNKVAKWHSKTWHEIICLHNKELKDQRLTFYFLTRNIFVRIAKTDICSNTSVPSIISVPLPSFCLFSSTWRSYRRIRT